MNVFEIAKICHFQTLESTTGHLNTVWAGDKNITQELEAFAAVISAQAKQNLLSMNPFHFTHYQLEKQND